MHNLARSRTYILIRTSCRAYGDSLPSYAVYLDLEDERSSMKDFGSRMADSRVCTWMCC